MHENRVLLRGRKDHYLPQGYLRGFIAPGRESLPRPLWCMRPHTGEWNYKSTAQIGYEVGFYDFANDALDAEHADTTFKEMENRFPLVRAQLSVTNFEGWQVHQDFLCRYMQMIRTRSPLYFQQKKAELATQYVWAVAKVDPSGTMITLENMEGRLLTANEIHDHTLSKMRDEFKQGIGWMNEYYWTMRTTGDHQDPFVAGEQPLFLSSDVDSPTIVMQHPSTHIYFPLCWQACLIGKRTPWIEDTQTIAPDKLRVIRRIIRHKANKFVVSPRPIDID
jgi:hypothetical protein